MVLSNRQFCQLLQTSLDSYFETTMLPNMKKTSVLLFCFGAVLTSCSKGTVNESPNSILSSTSIVGSQASETTNPPVSSQPVSQSNDIKSMDELLEALASEGLECQNFRTPKPEDDLLELNLKADSEGYCDLGTSQLHLAIFKNESIKTKELKRMIDSVCPTAKAFGISSVDYVEGGIWEIDNGTTEQLKVMAKKLNAEYQSVDC